MIMIQLCVQGSDFKYDLGLPVFEIIHQIPFFVFTAIPLTCDFKLYR